MLLRVTLILEILFTKHFTTLSSRVTYCYLYVRYSNFFCDKTLAHFEFKKPNFVKKKKVFMLKFVESCDSSYNSIIQSTGYATTIGLLKFTLSSGINTTATCTMIWCIPTPSMRRTASIRITLSS